MTEQNLKPVLAKLAIEYWRVLRSYERNLPSMQNSTSASGTIRNSEKKFTAILSENGLRVTNFEGNEYSPNLPLTVVNADEFDDNEGLVISQMIEPTIVDDDGVVSMGKAILAKKGT
ncbi:MAG: hypothetical protein H6863_03740 [Rhodospirillales bacterium]|nr:hypothetical protein [Rhodospirillales bacterium]